MRKRTWKNDVLVAAKRAHLGSVVAQRTLKVGGARCKLVLERAVWDGLEEIAEEMNSTVEEVVQRMYRWGASDNFQSEVRLYVLQHYRRKLDLAKASG
jgi:predicted DNA-binding ribbon-helix-helix protein